MKGVFLAEECLRFVVDNYKFSTVLDIGSGQGLHANRFRECGKKVVTLDRGTHWGTPDIQGDVLTIDKQPDIDLFWCSHVLEHQRNVGQFLDRLHYIANEGSLIAITIPPAKHQIVGGHVSIWNAGLLLYNLVLSGFDCKQAHVKQYGYNISVVVRKKTIQLPELHMDAGDIDKLSAFFPMPVTQGFNGDIKNINWE